MSGKQLKIQEKKPVVVFGVKQNCYALDCRKPGSSIPLAVPNRTIKKYYELEQKTLDNGYVEQVVEKDYPINSDSVSSYIESSDYRLDPNQAIAQAPKRVNLGDVTEVQDFMKNNPMQATLHYADVLQKVSQYMKQQASKGLVSPAPASAENGGEK